MEVSKIKFKKLILPNLLIRKLTRKDCLKGFHNFDQVYEDHVAQCVYEKCSTCNAVFKFSKLDSVMLQKKYMMAF